MFSLYPLKPFFHPRCEMEKDSLVSLQFHLWLRVIFFPQHFLLSLRFWCRELRWPQQPAVPVESKAEADDPREHVSEVQNPEELWDPATRRGTQRPQPHPGVGEGEAPPAAQKRWRSQLKSLICFVLLPLPAVELVPCRNLRRMLSQCRIGETSAVRMMQQLWYLLY